MAQCGGALIHWYNFVCACDSSRGEFHCENPASLCTITLSNQHIFCNHQVQWWLVRFPNCIVYSWVYNTQKTVKFFFDCFHSHHLAMHWYKLIRIGIFRVSSPGFQLEKLFFIHTVRSYSHSTATAEFVISIGLKKWDGFLTFSNCIIQERAKYCPGEIWKCWNVKNTVDLRLLMTLQIRRWPLQIRRWQ